MNFFLQSKCRPMRGYAFEQSSLQDRDNDTIDCAGTYSARLVFEMIPRMLAWPALIEGANTLPVNVE